MKTIRKLLFKVALSGAILLSPLRAGAQWEVTDMGAIAAVVDVGVTAAEQLTTLNSTFNTLKNVYSTVQSATNFLDGAQAVGELFELIDESRNDYADVVSMIDRVKNTYGASTVMPSSVYHTTMSAANMGLEFADKLQDIIGYCNFVLTNEALSVGDKLRCLKDLNDNLRQTRDNIRKIKNKLSGAIVFKTSKSRESGKAARIVEQAYSGIDEKSEIKKAQPLGDASNRGRKSEKGVLPEIVWSKSGSGLTARVNGQSYEAEKQQTLSELESSARNKKLVNDVFEITQYVIVGIGMLFTGVAYARRNKGDRASEDAIYKVILWFFLIMMMLSALKAMFF